MRRRVEVAPPPLVHLVPVHRADYGDLVAVNVVDHGMDIKEAVCAARFHSQWLPDVIQIEPRGLAKDVIENLELLGHKIVTRGDYIVESNCIMIKEEGIYGGADCRGETSAIGY